jgi:hypothetical protein
MFKIAKQEFVVTKKISFDSILLVVILVCAAILRFWNYSNMPYMHDELSALARTDFSSFSEMIAKGARVDGHPVGIQTFLYFWVRCFGNNEMIVKFPFIICGLLSIHAGYKIGKFWFNSSVSLIVASFMATMQFFVMYSQIARPYITGLLFSLLMVWCWSNYFFGTTDKKNKWLFGYIISSALCAYDHHIALLFALIVAFTGLFFLNKDSWKGYLLAGTAICVLYIPHLGIFFYQLSKGGVGGDTGWLSKPDLHWLTMFFRYTFHYSVWMYFLAGILILMSIFFYSKELKTNQKFRVISISWFLLIFIIAYYYSIKVNPILQLSTMIFVFPFVLMFLFSLMGELNKMLKTIVTIGILVVGTSTLVFARKHATVFYKQPYQSQITDTYKALDKIGSEKKATIELLIPPYFKEHYFKKYNRRFDCVYYNAFEESPDPKKFREFVNQQQTQFFIAGNLPLEYISIIKEKYPYMINKDEGFTYSFYCFSREKPVNELFEKTVFTESNTFIKESEHWSKDNNSIERIATGEMVYIMDSSCEYSTCFTMRLKDMISSRHNIINVSTDIYSRDTTANPVLAIEIHDGKESLVWRGSNYFWYNNKPKKTNKMYVSELLSGLDLQKHPNAEVKIYVWNKNKKTLFIDDINIQVIESNLIVYGLYEPIE